MMDPAIVAVQERPPAPLPSVPHPCEPCELSFDTEAEYNKHCEGEMHKKRTAGHGDGREVNGLAEEAGEWKHRPPPRGLTSTEYTKCSR
jgi:hypothetical protein